MSSTNNQDYVHIERERNVLDLYRQGKNTRDIAKELRMSLRDISIILRRAFDPRNSNPAHGGTFGDNVRYVAVGNRNRL
jgi:hypothetical protein